MQRKQSPRRRTDRARQQHAATSSPDEMYPLPQDTRDLVGAHASKCLNYGLCLERFLQCDSHSWELTKRAKERQGVRTFNQGDLQCIVKNHKVRWEAMLNDYRQRGFTINSFPMCADSRVIVGLGAESVLETSVRLHRVYGFPIIPASALKGLARSYAELMEHKDESDPTFAAVFGTAPPNTSAGRVIFFDAVPADPANLKLDLDVMNPHYSEYYQGGNVSPADYLNPIPIFFLAIAPGSQFLFAVASKKSTLVQKAQEWLQKGLEKMGVGAKTTSGYGLWRSVNGEGVTPTFGSSSRPAEPSMLETLPPSTTPIPAVVVDNSRKPIQVKVLVRGYEEDLFECGGVGNPASFPVGSYITVRYKLHPKTKRVASVTLVGFWKP